MKNYIDTIKAVISLAYRLEDDAFYDGQYETVVHMISLIYERSIQEVKTDLRVFVEDIRNKESRQSR